MYGPYIVDKWCMRRVYGGIKAIPLLMYGPYIVDKWCMWCMVAQY